MKVLFIGDIIGKPGRQAVNALLHGLILEHGIDFVVANGENAAGGIGLTPAIADELLGSGVDIITSGNHIWKYRNMVDRLNDSTSVIRPLNYPPGTPGKGYLIHDEIVVINLIGRVFIGSFDCPFRAIDDLIEQVNPLPPVILIDFHAEATSEKNALAAYLDGRVSAIVGTHTHIGTVDARVLPGGTAYVTDIGMVGPINSVIGDDSAIVIDRFLTQMPFRVVVGQGPVIFNSVLVEIDKTGKSTGITRIDIEKTDL